MKRKKKKVKRARKPAKKSGLLPPPAALARKEPRVHVNFTLNKKTVDFFRKAARRHGAKYQALIRELLDRYAAQYA